MFELWSRREGHIRPPDEPLHAEPGSRNFPQTFRVKVWNWGADAMNALEWHTSMGEAVNPFEDSVAALYGVLVQEYGREKLYTPPGPASLSGMTPSRQLSGHLKVCPDIEVMDFIDLIFQVSPAIDRGRHDGESLATGINKIFRDEGVGYEVVDEQVVRTDGDITHGEAVVPAIRALASGRFGAAEEEFAKAVGYFATGDYRNTVIYANASFESVLKAVTGTNGVAGDLIREARKQGLLPGHVGGTAVEGLEKVFHAIPAVRNQDGGHGLGLDGAGADERVARFVLTTTAGAIVLLASAPAAS
jgi:hypothetical protein